MIHDDGSSAPIIDDPPSPFVAAWLPRIAARLPPGSRALDVAMGRGRHACLLAEAGLRTFGVDRRLPAVRDAVARARREGRSVRGWCADVGATGLPRGAFALVLVTRFLQRELFGALRESVAAAAGSGGGFVIYETFTVRQRLLGFGPGSPEHLLEPGELRKRFDGFTIEFYEEVDAPEAVARLVARR